MQTDFLQSVPVLPSADIERDLRWYEQKMGMQTVFADDKYAAVRRENIWLHLQWHADTPDDPLLGGSVVRIFVRNIGPIFEEFVRRGTVTSHALRRDTPWRTDEFGVYDLNRNAIFIVEDLDSSDQENT